MKTSVVALTLIILVFALAVAVYLRRQSRWLVLCRKLGGVRQGHYTCVTCGLLHRGKPDGGCELPRWAQIPTIHHAPGASDEPHGQTER